MDFSNDMKQLVLIKLFIIKNRILRKSKTFVNCTLNFVNHNVIIANGIFSLSPLRIETVNQWPRSEAIIIFPPFLSELGGLGVAGH